MRVQISSSLSLLPPSRLPSLAARETSGPVCPIIIIINDGISIRRSADSRERESSKRSRGTLFSGRRHNTLALRRWQRWRKVSRKVQFVPSFLIGSSKCSIPLAVGTSDPRLQFKKKKKKKKKKWRKVNVNLPVEWPKGVVHRWEIKFWKRRRVVSLLSAPLRRAGSVNEEVFLPGNFRPRRGNY